MAEENQTDTASEDAVNADEEWARIDAEESGAAPAAQDDFTDELPEEAEDDPQGEAEATEETDETDEWAGVPDKVRSSYDELKAEKEKLEHRLRSDDGRVAALQRQIRELQQSREAKQEEPPEKDDEDLISKLGEYPEIQGPVGEIHTWTRKEIEGLKAELAEAKAARDADMSERAQSEAARLDELEPDWSKVMTSKGREVYEYWLQSQPESLQMAARRNEALVVDANAAAKVVGEYRKFLAQFEPKESGQQKPDASKRRERQLEGATSIRSRGGMAAAPGVPEEGPADEVWAAIDREEQRKARR